MGGPARWDDSDRAKAVAFERYLNSRCKSCGTTHDDWHDDDDYPLEEPYFESTWKICDGCVAVEKARGAIPEGTAGAYVTMVPLGTSTVLEPDDEDEVEEP
jgi:hypothetical protein